MPLVSVILPCYNAQDLITDAIESILSQSTKDWELIVVDDASTDKSSNVFPSFRDNRIKLIQLETNSGYPVAMNAGIAVARGKYIARMDADDVCEPTRLEEQLKAFAQYPDASFCGVARYRITPGGKRYVDRAPERNKYVREGWDDLLTGHRLFTDPSVMVEKEKVLAAGGYRTFQRSGMDVDLWFRLMEKYGPCVTITKPLFGKRLEPGSLIFKPETILINQVPRVLARQRQMHGTDDVMSGAGVNVESYIEQKLIRPVDESESRALIIGAAATCFSFGDGKGLRIYFGQAWRFSSGILQKASMVFALFKKMMGRLWFNPYQRITQ